MWWKAQTLVKISVDIKAHFAQPTKTHLKKNRSRSPTSLPECVSREMGRRHLLSKMCRSGPGHLLARCLRTTEQLSVCVQMFACVCVTLRDIPHHSEPTPNLTAAVLASRHQKTAIILKHVHNSFICSIWLKRKPCGKCVNHVVFKKSTRMLCFSGPGSRRCWEETHGLYLSRSWIIISWQHRNAALPLSFIKWLPVTQCPQAVEGQQPAAVCFCSRDIRLKVREQVPHWYFFTSAWVCRCARRFERSAKARLQCGQENGRSPKKQNERDEKNSLKVDFLCFAKNARSLSAVTKRDFVIEFSWL